MLTSNVRQIMEEKGFTIRALEEKTKLAQVTILRARTHEKIGLCNLKTLVIIARALDVRVHDLFEDEPDHHSQK
ncbi:MAG: helix-turn-helix domain-containing protein [Desulfomicrobium sp.]